jgi:hypothetical protein
VGQISVGANTKEPNRSAELAVKVAIGPVQRSSESIGELAVGLRQDLRDAFQVGFGLLLSGRELGRGSLDSVKGLLGSPQKTENKAR